MGSSWKLHAIFCNNMEINFDELAILKNLMPAAANDCNVFVTCLFINYGYLDGQSVWLQSERVGQNNCYHQATCVITLQLKVVTQRSLKSLGDVCRHNYLKLFSDHKKVIAITGKPPIFPMLLSYFYFGVIGLQVFPSFLKFMVTGESLMIMHNHGLN